MKAFSRTLIYIPVVHTQADLGVLGRSIHRTHRQINGKTSQQRKASAIDQIWIDIESAVTGLDLDYGSVRLYQDSLPVCGHELDIVEELAAKGSRNHQLLLRMTENGATLMGTESAELLIKEYEHYKHILENGHPTEKTETDTRRKASADSLLHARDRYIGQRVNQTLPKGDTGILFLGVLHRPEPFFEQDIHLIYPIGKPAAS
ncbi:MAG: hypothetical protein K9K82_11415 [Desulfobacteraceae bacterium]|nr:hypothetical protein [Desulfobacteraceae bacterium]MCF8050327.1 hypothetical protein [Desulfobacterales bacterium]MCF8080962.1 hypothetical protein [Desulfobacterales bacterium]